MILCSYIFHKVCLLIKERKKERTTLAYEEKESLLFLKKSRSGNSSFLISHTNMMSL